MTSHAIKIEDLDLETSQADVMEETFKDILSEIGFSDERIGPVDCRSYSGFIPHSHNKGGILAYCYTTNSSLAGSGYDYGDGVIQKWSEYQNESYSKDHPGKYKYINQYQEGKRTNEKLYETLLDHYYEYMDGCSDYDSTQFEVRFMVIADGTVDVNVFGSTMDAPYFRSQDYNKHQNFEFKDAETFKKEVLSFLDTCDCIDLISECY